MTVTKVYCDRCGKEITGEGPLERKSYTIDSKHEKRSRFGFLRFRHRYYETERTHTVCEECLEDFWAWYQSKGAKLE